MLFNEPKLLKSKRSAVRAARDRVSVLFNEPKLLKSDRHAGPPALRSWSFSALQRAEIAEIKITELRSTAEIGFSALQRAEIAEIEGNE